MIEIRLFGIVKTTPLEPNNRAHEIPSYETLCYYSHKGEGSFMKKRADLTIHSEGLKKNAIKGDLIRFLNCST